MSLRLRLLALLLAVFSVGAYCLTRWTLDQIRPRYLESMEESLVDTSVWFASMIEQQLSGGQIDTGALRRAFASVKDRHFQATIFSLKKTAVDMRLYVTDAKGRVLFDSTGLNEGKDFSRWNDVARTLQGRYGARSTRDVPGDDNTQVIYVAAPVSYDGRIVGVISVGKPALEINALVAVAKRKVLLGVVGGSLAVLVSLLLVTSWVIAPIERLTAYARAVRDQRAVALPSLPGRTLRTLATAFEEMRDALEGRQQVERHTQILAHEVKAPLAAIRGAAELMEENMPEEQRKKFLGNIRGESARIQKIVERLLELSSLEARKTLQRTERLEASKLLDEAASALRPAFDAKRVTFETESVPGIWIAGERVLLREALVNLLQNALDFTPAGGCVRLWVEAASDRVTFLVEDNGPGVPEYALGKVFDKFYSLPRPGTDRKSTGLGLSLVREIAHLHGGETALSNRPDGGARAAFSLPRQPS